MVDAERNSLAVGVTCSVILHGILLYCLAFGIGFDLDRIGAPIVYSISLEGGETLGGLAQVPKREESSVAPPKNVSAEAVESRQEAVEKPEVVLPAEKKKEPVKPKPVEKKIEASKPPPKPEPKKAQPKPQPKQPTAADINKDYQRAMQRYLGESTEAGGKGFGAGAVGGRGMGGGVQRPPEFFTYRQILRDRVKQGWKWYDTSAALVTWVTFDIAPDGTISNVEVAEASGNRVFDDSVVRAVVKASPLPPPPSVVYADFRSVRMSFDPRE